MTDRSMEATTNGPYIVKGGVPLRRRRMVVSEHGEPLTWDTGDPIDTRDTYALCRCGGSDNKPFCDGTHARNAFDGTETASTAPYDETRVSLGGEHIEIFDDPAICIHAGYCGNEQTNVWEMAGETADSVVRSHAMAMVERCPSGRLTYAVDGEQVEPHLPDEIALIENGPLWITGGGVEMTRSDGAAIEQRNRVTLCRCGASSNKPFCDGTHNDIGFEG